MTVNEFIEDALNKEQEYLLGTVQDLTPEELAWRPGPEANPIGWILWHMLRVEDFWFQFFIQRELELWEKEGWHEKFGMAKDEKETGTGHTPEQVEALKVDSADLPLGYADAVFERAKQYLATVKPADLDAEINEPQYDPLPTVGVRLVSIISDNIQHAGQVMYVRGLLERQGWLGV